MLRRAVTVFTCVAKPLVKSTEAKKLMVSGPVAGLHTTCKLYTDLSNFQLKKLTAEFDHLYDRNSDGYVDPMDVDYFKRKMRSYLAMTHSLAVQDKHFVGFNDYCLMLREFADTNKDGKLSRQEWIDLWADLLKNIKDTKAQSLPQWLQMMPRSLFPLMDIKDDGILDKEEYGNFWHEVGGYPEVDDARLDEIFAVMTENGKFKMDVQRMVDLYADFYLSDDQSTPGKYIAGPIDFDSD